MSYKGRFIPSHPEKYVGNIHRIIYRSGWERSVMVKLDRHPGIVQWSSEPMGIPYVSPLDGRTHKYFPDLWMKVKTKNGDMETFLVEIKPFRQSVAPNLQDSFDGRKKKRYLRDSISFAINNAKWTSARRLCESQKWKFKVWTEKDVQF